VLECLSELVFLACLCVNVLHVVRAAAALGPAAVGTMSSRTSVMQVVTFHLGCSTPASAWSRSTTSCSWAIQWLRPPACHNEVWLGMGPSDCQGPWDCRNGH